MTDDGGGPAADSEPGEHWSYTACGVVVASGLLVAGLWGLHGMYRGVQHKAWETVCRGNLHVVGVAMKAYCADYDDRLPLADNWCDEIHARVGVGHRFPRDVWYDCPALPGDDCSYALNAALAGLEVNAALRPEATVLAFDGPAGWNRVGGADHAQFRHPRSRTICKCLCVDGRVTCLSATGRDIDPLRPEHAPPRWEP